MSDRKLNNVLMQYFINNPIVSSFKPSQVLDTAKPVAFSQGDSRAVGHSTADTRQIGWIRSVDNCLQFPTATGVGAEHRYHTHASSSAIGRRA